MKKSKIFLPMMALALVFGLAACGGNNAQSQSQGGGKSSQPSSSVPAKPKITVSAEGNKKELLKDETVQLSAKEGETALTGVEWKSSDANVATVSDAGLVTAVFYGEATITASKEGYQNGTISIKVKRPDPTATLHFEVADHYSADGEWTNSSRGPGETPVYEKSSASDGTCVGYFGDGDKETLTFTSNAAVKAELVVTMGHNSSFTPLSEIMEAKFNNAAIDLSKTNFESDSDGQGNYTFQGVSFGQVDLLASNNVLEISMKGNAPYLDDLQIYAASAATIVAVPAPEKPSIVISNPESELTIEAESTVQLQCATEGVIWASSSETVATVSQTGLVTGVAKGTASITARKDGMKTAKVTITVTEKVVAGEIRAQAESGTVDGAALGTDTAIVTRSTSTGETCTAQWEAGKTLVIKFTGKAGSYKMYLNGRAGGQYGMSNIEDLAAVIELKLNNAAVSIPASTAISGRTFTDYLLANAVTLKEGENTLEVKALGEESDKAPNIDFFKFTPNA